MLMLCLGQANERGEDKVYIYEVTTSPLDAFSGIRKDFLRHPTKTLIRQRATSTRRQQAHGQPSKDLLRHPTQVLFRQRTSRAFGNKLFTPFQAFSNKAARRPIIRNDYRKKATTTCSRRETLNPWYCCKWQHSFIHFPAHAEAVMVVMRLAQAICQYGRDGSPGKD